MDDFVLDERQQSQPQWSRMVLLASQDEEEKPQQRWTTRFIAVWLVILFSFINTLPFFTVITHLSEIDGKKFVPCSDQVCLVWSLTNSDGVHPSTLSWGKSPYHTVSNGWKDLRPPLKAYLSPICPGNTSAMMRDICHKHATKAKIVNTLSHGISKTVYVCCCVIWVTLKVIHDWLLIYEHPERLTIWIGIVSWIVQLWGCAASFVWCMSATGSFIAQIDDNCGCYYSLPTLESILAMATPVVLLVHVILKLDKIFRSAMFGDFLYSIRYDVPIHIITASLKTPVDMYIVGNTCGAYECDRNAIMSRKMQRDDLRNVGNFNFMCLRPMRQIGILLISLSLTPISARFLQLLNSGNNSCRPHLFLACAFIATSGFLSWVQMRNLFDCRTQKWNEQFLEKEFCCVGFLSICRHMFYVLLSVGSASAAVFTLFQSCFDRLCTQTPGGILLWSVSLSLNVWSLLIMVLDFRLRSVTKALTAKTGLSKASPIGYLVLAKEYPEFDLDEEKQLAETLKRTEGAYSIRPSSRRRTTWSQLKVAGNSNNVGLTQGGLSTIQDDAVETLAD